MKVLLILAVCGFVAVLAAPEAPAAPYAASGWRPSGPAFELPTEEKQPSVEYASPELTGEVEVTEEELQYNGDIATTEATTPFLEYGAPATNFPDEGSVYSSSASGSSEENDLSVQGLPSSEPAAEFRSLKSQRFTAGRNQRLQAPRAQGQFRQQQFVQQNQFQRQQVSTFQVQPQFARPQQRAQQFGRITASNQFRQNAKSRALPAFGTRLAKQEVAPVDSYGAPAQEYGPPQQAYGPPDSQPETDSQLPEEEPEQSPENNSSEEVSDPDDGPESGNNVAISTAIATGRYVQKPREGRRLQNLRKPARLQQFNEPVYMYNQFGQLVRVL